MERPRIRTLEELDRLDQDEIVEGFVDAYRGEPEPGDNRSAGYRHGYANGQDDRLGRHNPDSIALAKALSERRRTDAR